MRQLYQPLSFYYLRIPIIFKQYSGSEPWQTKKVILGSWERFEDYAKDILEVNHCYINFFEIQCHKQALKISLTGAGSE